MTHHTQKIDLKDIIQSLQKGEVTLLASHIFMGKTRFSIRLVEEIMRRSNLPTVIFSIDLPIHKMAQRYISHNRINNLKTLESGKTNELIWEASKTTTKKLYINDIRPLAMSQIFSESNAIAIKYNNQLGMVVIDYFQLITLDSPNENQDSNCEEVFHQLKKLAEQFNCTVLILYNLNYAIKYRKEKRPKLNDINEAKLIDKYLDTIIFLSRKTNYSEYLTGTHNIEAIIAKNSQQIIGSGIFIC